MSKKTDFHHFHNWYAEVERVFRLRGEELVGSFRKTFRPYFDRGYTPAEAVEVVLKQEPTEESRVW